MTWRGLIENLQKEVERDICDVLAVKAIEWGVKQGAIDEGPAGWQDAIAHQWPVMPEVDPTRTATAFGQNMGYGITSVRDVLGPNGEQIATKNREISDRIMGRRNNEQNQD
jgi:hypothetical protein